jgi:membrane protein required for beta-lactamase induction
MSAKGHLTGWTSLLILAGIGLAIAGAVMAPETLPTWLMAGGFAATWNALNNIYGPVRRAAREHEIREDERARHAGGAR